MPLLIRIQDAVAKKTRVGAEQMKTLFADYIKDMDYLGISSKQRTPEHFGKWLYGKVSMPSSQRYVPESREAWEKFVASMKWGE